MKLWEAHMDPLSPLRGVLMNRRQKVDNQEHSIKLREMRGEISNDQHNFNREGDKVYFFIPSNMYAF